MSTKIFPKFKSGNQFYFELRQKVEEYFRTNELSKFGDYRLVIKTVVLLIAYFGAYSVVLFAGLPAWGALLVAVFMGVAIAGIGMGVMHDANHGSYSKNRKLNNILGKTADLLGASSSNWINQHNKLHHTYTNIYEHDEDVNGKGFFRFSPDAPLKKVHRFQHIYWTLLYGLLTLGWYFADFQAYKKYREWGLNKKEGKQKRREITEIIAFKIFFLIYLIIVPIIVTDYAWWQVLIGFLGMHYTAGLILSVVFQMAHVVDKFDLSNHDKFTGTTKDEWAIHQIHNTFNFATDNKLVTWYCGGLNYQIEHHLFPNISHIHYPKLHGIIKETALKNGVNYHEFDTFREAFASHLLFLKKLGRPQPVLA
ncbi:MAG: acyl-CoA desaturase [Bacteroidia bacterium]